MAAKISSTQRHYRTPGQRYAKPDARRVVREARDTGPSRLILFNKPFGVICQFSKDGDRQTLADFIKVPEVYPAGRLDHDSEGLLILTNDGRIQARISAAKSKTPKTYWVQVERIPDEAALRTLERGINLGDFVTAPARARLIDEPENLWPRDPPIRHRLNVPTSWIEIQITEGKNRQVRRMTAAVGHPTLRLIRVQVGDYKLGALAPGQSQEIDLRPRAPQPRADQPSPSVDGDLDDFDDME